MKKGQNEEKQILLQKINILRGEMISTGVNKGLSDDKTIEISRKLDDILNKYQSLK